MGHDITVSPGSVYCDTLKPWNVMMIKHMCEQCIPGVLFPLPLAPGYMQFAQVIHSCLCTSLLADSGDTTS